MAECPAPPESAGDRLGPPNVAESEDSVKSLPEGPWPPEHLERVPDCPVCGSVDRRLRHERLRDETFFTAKGEWTLWECGQCGSGWLDPRPDEASIGDAYGHYYTHEEETPQAHPSLLRRLKKAASNDYRFWRFGSRRAERLPGGRLVGRLFPLLTRPVDLEMRFLPRPRASGSTLLDVGCGNGAFLSLASEAGWEGHGVEPDEKAAQIAAQRGFQVRPFLPDWADGRARFDAMTFNHTIEHVHDPVVTLALAHSLLRPGGFLYLETPNMAAVGHDLYGRHWRGLETPRHLVLFSHRGLLSALRKSGFARIEVRTRPSPLVPMAELSRRQACGLDPYSSSPLPPLAPPLPQPAAIEEERSRIEKREFLTITAVREGT